MGCTLSTGALCMRPAPRGSCDPCTLPAALSAFISWGAASLDAEQLQRSHGMQHARGRDPDDLPRTARSQSYGCEVDVYSFGIMAYEMLECLQPFGELSSRLVARRAGVRGGGRPAAHDA